MYIYKMCLYLSTLFDMSMNENNVNQCLFMCACMHLWLSMCLKTCCGKHKYIYPMLDKYL